MQITFSSPGDDKASAPGPTPPEPAERASPLGTAELRAALARPDLLATHVLGSADRVAASLSGPRTVWLLTLVLAWASVAMTIPYGLLAPVPHWWTVAALFTGSLLICFPSLHVFLVFLGFEVRLDRSLSLALVMTAAAGLFTLGFAPIVWFIAATTEPSPRGSVTPAGISACLLAVALLLGTVQIFRCLGAARFGSGGGRPVTAPVLVWLPLLVFIVWRMADVLGIR